MANEDFFDKQTPSSRIKANIVANYFPKYCKIINKKKQSAIHYVDLYAGPGKYKDGNPSTPLLIGEACAEDGELKSIVLLMFNDNAYKDDLEKNFIERFPSGTFKNEPRFASKTVGDDDGITNYLMKKWGSPNATPTLLFVDPFGYKSINTNALANFMNGWGNEIFLFLNVKRIQAALDNDKFDELMLCLFPTTVDSLKSDRKYKSNVYERLNLIVDNLHQEFQKKSKEKIYHTKFRFKEEDSLGTSHFIIHFTKHSRGYDLVKQIYHEFDNIGASLESDGSYTFDAKKLDDNNSTIEFGDANVDALSDMLEKKYKGRKLTARELFEEHHTSTQFSAKHYVKTLRHMAEGGKIKPTFTDSMEHRVSVLLTNHCIIEFV